MIILIINLTATALLYAAVAFWVGWKTWRDVRDRRPGHVVWHVLVTVTFAAGWPLALIAGMAVVAVRARKKGGTDKLDT